MKNIKTLIEENKEKRRLLQIEEYNRYLKDNELVEVEMKAGDEDCTLVVKEDMKDNIPDLLIESINEIQEQQPEKKKKHALLVGLSLLFSALEAVAMVNLFKEAIECLKNYQSKVPISAVVFSCVTTVLYAIIISKKIDQSDKIEFNSAQLKGLKECLKTNYPDRMAEINPEKGKTKIYIKTSDKK